MKLISFFLFFFLIIFASLQGFSQSSLPEEEFSREEFKKIQDAELLIHFLADSVSQLSDDIERIFTTDGKRIQMENTKKANETITKERLKLTKGANIEEKETKKVESAEELNDYIINHLAPNRAIIQSRKDDNSYEIRLIEFSDEKEM